MTGPVDQTARDTANQAMNAISSHERECAIRYATLIGNQERIESIIKWAGGLMVSIFLALIGWSFLQLYSNNEMQKQELKQQVDLYKAQLDAARTTQPALPSVSVREDVNLDHAGRKDGR